MITLPVFIVDYFTQRMEQVLVVILLLSTECTLSSLCIVRWNRESFELLILCYHRALGGLKLQGTGGLFLVTATAVSRGHFGRLPGGRDASRIGDKVTLKSHIHKTKAACVKHHHKVISTLSKLEAVLFFFLIWAPKSSYKKPAKGYSEALDTFPTGLKDETVLRHLQALPQSRCIVYVFQQMSVGTISSQKYQIIFF